MIMTKIVVLIFVVFVYLTRVLFCLLLFWFGARFKPPRLSNKRLVTTEANCFDTLDEHQRGGLCCMSVYNNFGHVLASSFNIDLTFEGCFELTFTFKVLSYASSSRG